MDEVPHLLLLLLLGKLFNFDVLGFHLLFLLFILSVPGRLPGEAKHDEEERRF